MGKFSNMLKNALISIAVFVSWFWYTLLSLRFDYSYELFRLCVTPSLWPSTITSIHSVFRSIIRFKFCHPLFTFLLSLCLLSRIVVCELISINLLSQFFFYLRNVIKPIVCKLFESEIVFKEFSADFEFCSCWDSSTENPFDFANELFQGTIKTTSKRNQPTNQCGANSNENIQRNCFATTEI